MRNIFYLLLLFPFINLNAATFNSAQTGDFDVASTWVEAGFPTFGDIIIINDGHTVTLSETGDVILTGSLVIHEKGKLIVEIIEDGGGDNNALVFDGDDFHIMGDLSFVEPDPGATPPTIGKDLVVQGTSFLWFHENSITYISDDLLMQGSTNIIADECVDVTDDMYISGTGSKLCGASNISIGKYTIANDVFFQNGANSNQICINSNIKRDNNFGTCGPDVANGNNNFNPVATNDTGATDENIATTIDVLDQGTADSDLLGDPLEIVSAGYNFLNDNISKYGGTVTINNNGTSGNVGDDYIDYLPAPGFSGQDTFFYAISDGNGGFSDALVAVTVTASLPVELSEFRASETSCAIDLEWNTLTETENHFFEVERSEDGKFFKAIGRVNGAGNSSSVLQYTFKDKLPEFSNYYRLKQYDLNGMWSYSKTIYIESICIEDNGNIGIVKVYPNPVMNENIAIRFNAAEEENTFAYVTDLYGKHILRTPLEIQRGMNHIELKLDFLPAGTYFIRVHKKTTKFVKIKD